MKQVAIAATYMRGGTSKGVFFTPDAFPAPLRDNAALRDQALLRIIGSPDAYGKHTDGMGGATSSTSKVVIVQASARPDCDVDYWFGAVSIEQALIDWSGNCGNLTAAVGPFAIAQGLVSNCPTDGVARVRIWQANLGKIIIAHVPMCQGEVVEMGDFELDGVAFPAAEIRLEFLEPGAEPGAVTAAMFPTGKTRETIQVPGMEPLELTLINAGNPTIFVSAQSLGLRGTELQADINGDRDFLERCEAVRAHCAVLMGLADTAHEASLHRPATPKLAFVAPPAGYTASNGKSVSANDIELLARILSMGKLHHAMTGTGAVALAVAGAIPDTVVSATLAGGACSRLRFGHPSGTLSVGADAKRIDGQWRVERAQMSRSARRLMVGHVLVPAFNSLLSRS